LWMGWSSRGDQNRCERANVRSRNETK
jgi:hypothetical protein